VPHAHTLPINESGNVTRHVGDDTIVIDVTGNDCRGLATVCTRRKQTYRQERESVTALAVIASVIREHQRYTDPRKERGACICGWVNDGSGSWPKHVATEIEAASKQRFTISPGAK
jgi:hypothetical protein